MRGARVEADNDDYAFLYLFVSRSLSSFHAQMKEKKSSFAGKWDRRDVSVRDASMSNIENNAEGVKEKKKEGTCLFLA